MTFTSSRTPRFLAVLSTLRANLKPLPTWRKMSKSAMKHFVSNCTGGIPLLVTILEKTQDQHIRHFVILIMEKMLLHKTRGTEHAQAFVLHNATDHLLKLIVKCQLSWGDDFICSLYKVTVKIGDEDKKFAVKARFLGVLPVIVSHIKAYSRKLKVLNTIMKLLKKIMASSVNATKLSKDGLPRELIHFLEEPKKVTIIPVLNAISEATRTRHSARQFVKEDVVSRILLIIFGTDVTSCSKVNASICKICLRILVHLTQIKLGREKLLSSGTIPSLLSWCKTLVNLTGNHYISLVSLVSTVVQRCLPARPLPVRKLNNPVTFTFSECFYMNESDSSDGKNDDTVSLGSSNLSSVDSGTDSDEELRPFDVVESQYGESYEQFSSFFEEINEFHPLKPHFTSGDDVQNNCFKTVFYEKFVPSTVIEFNDTKLNPIIPKNIPRHSFVQVSRKETQRKMRKPASDSSLHMKEKSPKTLSLIPVSSCGPTNCSKIPKKTDFSSPSCDTNVIPSSNITCDSSYHLTDLERFTLIENAKEEIKNKKLLDKVCYSDVYQKQSLLTTSVSPHVKLAYPDYVNCSPDSELDYPFFKPDPFLIREKIYQHAEEMAQNDFLFTDIYNLDNLLCENVPSSNPLHNKDCKRIHCDQQSEYLQFESRFESGNLRKVFWKGGGVYDLILNPDINSKTHIQWFYFEVSGMKANYPYTFNIINMEKSTSQFNEGMCPVMFSVRNHMEKKQGWTRVGSNICYYRNHYTQSPSTNSILRSKPFYTLTFTINFQHANDVCYIAYHYPYTFTTLLTHIYCWTNSYDSTVYLKKDELCKTLSGNSVPLLTITSKPVDSKRPYIFLSARVHSGESNSSWVMKGVLDFLLSKKGEKLREMYIFKIVPMLNPDGVINGCHRCSLSGQDLNRQWITPNCRLHPTIYYTKSLLHYLASKNKRPLVFCDFHGHSRRSNAFFFGCNPEQSWWPTDETKPFSECFKILPVLMHEMAPTFCLNYCNFAIERNRESTGRVTVWRQFGVQLSYTLECSYGGCNQGKYAGYHIGISHLEDTGAKLCLCFEKLEIDEETNLVLSSIPIDLNLLLSPDIKTFRPKQYTTSSSTESYDDIEASDENDLPP
ncbi:cytosolic carboxypeptidase 1 isoform X2 [Parasteatoda tepidariorum]|uniref:cytosolic carboxypeptidase 1 isoform X2 n=1 Tax=Parasteatoda tepidariorum TaxID=114398 RepID=UPI001C71F399|nr:cytosolic carboxypeptidase 1 isoform X2 [Parasteatoda tepidariorum]XP_042895364.1 cytosolic carboxypeptidase 1 isoform X2 [Parasteatoda tepidariorum]